MAFVLTPARLAANRANAQKAGRPAGSRNRKTLIAEHAARALAEKQLEYHLAVVAKTLELFETQYRITQQTDSLAAANAAIDSLLDRTYGRPTPRPDDDQAPRAPVTIVHVYASGTEPQPARAPDVHILPATKE